MMRNWIIKLLGGYTRRDMEIAQMYLNRAALRCRELEREIQRLDPSNEWGQGGPAYH